MSRTYTLTSTAVHGGRYAGGSDHSDSQASQSWRSYVQADAQGRWVGYDSSNSTYWRATNILFNADELTALRSKSISSITLKVTATGGKLPSQSYGIHVRHKYNSTDYGDATSQAWASGNNGSMNTTDVGLLNNGSSRRDITSDETFSISVGTTIPQYGYVLGCANNPNSYLILSSSNTGAQLVVVTNESLTLSYSANGGSGAPSSETKNGTPNASFTVSSTVPTRTGYDFSGWNTKSDGTGTNYSAGSSITLSENITLYAKWTLKTYTVSYNANGGSGAPSSQTKDYGVTLQLSTTVPTKTGYNFLGWAETSSATAAAYSAGGNFTKNADTTLYAVWSANTYAVSYLDNAGGDPVTNMPAAQTKTHGTNLTLSSTRPTRTGYTFSTWNTAADGTGTDYSPGATYTGNSSLTLYAVWTINTYTVSYNMNGGDGTIANQTKTYNVALTLSSTVPTRTNYTFMGWSESNTAVVPTYLAGGSFTNNANTVLFAVWRLNLYTVSYNANGGTGAPASQTKTHGVDLTLSSTEPTRSGYAFFGWATSSSATTAEYQPGDTFTTDANTTLYAVWRALYTVSYNSDGGTPVPYTQTKIEGVDLVLSDIVPEKAGYTFDEWQDGSSNTYAPGDTYSTDADLALTAQWTATSLPKYEFSRYIANYGLFLMHNCYVVENGVPVLQDIYVK